MLLKKNQPNKLKFRSEIEGLRGLAVIPVVFYHAGFNTFNGGFVGVDIFFVISGYLITSIILYELENKNFSLVNFYERRVRRILPALFLVIFVSSILSFVLLSRSELSSFFQSVNSSILFYSNFHFWKTAPYFKSESEIEPLLHTWSLSIEEQFYIFFPIIIILFNLYLKKWILTFLIFGFILSLSICHFVALKTGGTLNFYFTLTRSWELALGSIVAYLMFHYKIFLNSLNNYFSLLGLLLIFFSIFFFSKQILYPSIYTLIPTLGTAFVIYFTKDGSYVKKFLSNKIFLYIGLISYSFYLWHQPLLAFGKIYFDNFSVYLKFFLIFVSLIFSYISYHFTEKIFRDKKKISVKSLNIFVFLFILIFLPISYLNINHFSAKSSYGVETKLAKLLLVNDAVYMTKMNDRQFTKSRIIYENLSPEILIIGSSRTMQISNDEINNNVINLSVSGASVEDHIVITEMALNKFKPKYIILSADPWLFNSFKYPQRWKSLENEFSIAIDNIDNKENNKNILNQQNLRKNLKLYESFFENFYKLVNVRKLEIENFENKERAQTIIRRDGKRIYGKNEISEIIEKKVIDYRMEDFKFSNNFYSIYTKFLNHLIEHHKIKVLLFLSPYHHDSYDLTIKAIPAYLEMEKKFKELALKKNIEILGSYDPEQTECLKSEFYDVYHPKGSCVSKIFNQHNFKY